MSFNSVTFLFWFLPVFLVAYYLCRLRLRACLLLVCSLFVYAWGSQLSLIFLIGFIGFNYVMGLLVESHKNTMPLAVVLDVAFLLLFKFTSAGADFGLAGGMPLGVSFFTLSGISYIADISRGKTPAAKNPVKLALYIAMFPKLMVGPVVQYADIEDQLDWPSVNSDMVASGMLRFSIGLFKKLVFAGMLYDVVFYCWPDAPNSTASAWLAIVAYSLELYYDFSGYSDMAIGLASMLGFSLKENFIYPYASHSLSDFWRRWHASLGAFFRDYVYIPLGGSRTGATLRNMFIVWLLTALWHGTGTQFLCWGALMLIAALIEKGVRSAIRSAAAKSTAPESIGLSELGKIIGSAYTVPVVMAGWVFFNSANAAAGFMFFGNLFGNASAASSGISDMYFANSFPLLLIAALGATPIPKEAVFSLIGREGENNIFKTVLKCLFMSALLVSSTIYLVNMGYTPFIYAQF